MQSHWKSFIKAIRAIDSTYKGIEYNRLHWDYTMELKVNKFLEFKLAQWKSQH